MSLIQDARRKPSSQGNGLTEDLESNNYHAKRKGHLRRRVRKANSKASSTTPPTQEMEATKSRSISILRFILFGVWILAAIVVSYSVVQYTEDTHVLEFELQYQHFATQLIQSFEDAIHTKLVAINTLATALTSASLHSQMGFPFVTLPDFGVLGSNARILADALAIHWLPLVTDEQRLAWEEYAMEHRFHIDGAFAQDEELRRQEDVRLGYASGKNNAHDTSIRENSTTTINGTLQDGTRYHPRIWELTDGLESPEGTGPLLPLWQRSPVDEKKQSTLNLNLEKSIGLQGIFPYLLEKEQPLGVLLNRATTPNPAVAQLLNHNIRTSQYRHNAEPYAGDPETKVAYPVLDGWDPETAQLAGILQSTLYWRLYFTSILPQNAKGIVCFIENTFGQSFAYRVDGYNVTYLGTDPYGAKNHTLPLLLTKHMVTRESIVIGARPEIETRSYTTLPLDKNYSEYTLKVYPTTVTRDVYLSKSDTRIYAGLVASIFMVAALVFFFYDFLVEQRRRHFSEKAIEQAHSAANAERELNEYIAHEVRNPLSAAMSACSFVRSAIQDNHWNEQVRQSVQDDVGIIDNSLRFINELLRSMLDLHRATDRHLQVSSQPTDLAHDVLEPVANMLYQRDEDFAILWECPDDLLVETDPLRLKQVLFNLGRNSTKFVQEGFVRLRAEVVESTVRLYVEDSGPGIPPDKQETLFAKFQESLDILSQGTGIGLCLCKQLMEIMEGDIWVDNSFESGVPGCPGTRFVVDLQKPPFQTADLELSAAFRSLPARQATVESDTTMETSTKDEETNQPRLSILEETDPEVGMMSTTLPDELSVLFVDDDMILRKLFRRTIQRVCPSWKVQEAANGETAIRLTDSEDFDLIFLDQYMASTEKQLLGTETARELRAKGVTSTICGLSANNVEQAFLGAGADAFWSKPITCDKEELLEGLQALLQTSFRC